MAVCGCCGFKPETQRKALWVLLVALVFTSLFVVVKERRFAKEVRRLSPVLSELVPASCVPSPHNDGLYVHLECAVRNSSTFYPPENFAKNLPPFHGVFFEVKAEMFQYASLPDFLGRRNPKWVDHLVPRSMWSLFDGLRNPDFFPHVPGVGRQLASGLKAGGFNLPGDFSFYFRKKQQLPLQDDGVYKQEEQRPPRVISGETTRVYNNYLYTGNPIKPDIGDVRISFWANASSHISIIGKQVKPYFGSARAIVGAAGDSKEGQPLTIAAEGDYEPQRLIEHRLKELLLPRLAPPAETPAETGAGGKYYDLGICLQMPVTSAATETTAAAAPECKQGTVIRWTTTPALGPQHQSTSSGAASSSASPATTATGATTSEAPSPYGSTYKNPAEYGVYRHPAVLQARAGSLTNISLQKSASKGSI